MTATFKNAIASIQCCSDIFAFKDEMTCMDESQAKGEKAQKSTK
jgi:hypothetical protein